MPLILVRTLLVYLLVIAAMRLLGKRQLGELQPSELVSAILISNLATRSIEEPGVSLLSSSIPVLAIAAAELLLSALCFQKPTVRRWIAGKPIVVLHNGKPDPDALRKLRFTVEELTGALRSQGIFDLRKVAWAIVETNGALSVCLREPGEELPFLPLVQDGCIQQEYLALCGLSQAWLDLVFQQESISCDQVLLLLGNESGDYQLTRKTQTPRPFPGSKRRPTP